VEVLVVDVIAARLFQRHDRCVDRIPIVVMEIPKLLGRVETGIRCRLLLVANLEDERPDDGGENDGDCHHQNDSDNW
jgi:hypothetical protein